VAIVIRFFVPGTPAPKGSPRVITRGRGGHPLPFPRVLSDSPATDAWAACVTLFARQAMRGREPWADAALDVLLVFGLARPLTHYGTGKNEQVIRASAPAAPQTKPDIDKLTRTTLDALQGPVFDEDSRIVRLEAIKIYAARGCETGAVIVVRAAADVAIAEAGIAFDRDARAFIQSGVSRERSAT
jgi:Holliday junction resolvase RusA-like endonuclease